MFEIEQIWIVARNKHTKEWESGGRIEDYPSKHWNPIYRVLATERDEAERIAQNKWVVERKERNAVFQKGYDEVFCGEPDNRYRYMQRPGLLRSYLAGRRKAEAKENRVGYAKEYA